MNWDDIRLFNAVAQSRSIRGAALSLNISHSTVSRRINELEKVLGARLFDRLPKGYFLTEVGQKCFQISQGLDEHFCEVERLAAGQDERLAGDIRITMPDIFAKLLIADFGRFAAQYPEVNLIVIPSYDLLNIDNREADVALRVVTTPPDHLVGWRLLEFASTAYASVEYLGRHGPLHESTSVSWIGWDQAELNPALAALTPQAQKPVAICLGNVLLQLESAKAGLGVSVLPCFLGDSEPTLRRAIADLAPRVSSSWLLMHPDMRRNARIKLFMTFLRQAIKKHEPLLLGERNRF